MFLHLVDRLLVPFTVVGDGKKLNGRAKIARHLVQVVQVGFRVVGRHPPQAIALPELAYHGRMHRATGRQVHVGTRLPSPEDQRVATAEDFIGYLPVGVDGRLGAGAAAFRRILSEPVGAGAIGGSYQEVLRAGDRADLLTHEVADLPVILVLDYELDDLALEVRDVQRHREVTIVREPFLADEEEIGGLVDVEDDAVRELGARGPDEVEPRGTGDGPVRPHERGRDQRLYALRLEPVA